MLEKQKRRHVVVMGIGNLLRKDDGVGIHALQKLQETGSFPADINVEFIDCGIEPDISIFLESSVDKLVIIDAVQAHGKPGAIYRLTPDVLESERQDIVSAHDLNLRESLIMMRLFGNLPVETVIIGVEPGEMKWGTTLTPEVEVKFPELISIILREIAL
ncbi:MAG TPA: hydrogenase maturation protease [Dehalococcoidales bacterium]